MEHLSIEISEVGHHEDEDGLDDSHFMCEPRDEAGGEAPHAAYTGASNSYYQEWCQARQNVRVD